MDRDELIRRLDELKKNCEYAALLFRSSGAMQKFDEQIRYAETCSEAIHQLQNPYLQDNK